MAQFPTVGSTFAGYTIDRQIGSGGMGAVFVAMQTNLNRPVALKVLLPQLSEGADWRRRFEREAAALASMDSLHVTHIHDFGEHDGCLYIATQYVAGGDLAALLASGPLAPDVALQVAEQVASALAEAHERGVVHRDIKPSNILLRGGNEPWAYVCDFGIADRDGDQTLTQTGAFIGSIGYLAPERTTGGATTAASDQYSLGCMLVEMLTGRPPFQGTTAQVLAAHASAPPPRWQESGPFEARLNQIVARSMAKDPAHRYRSMREVHQALRELRATIPTQGAGVPADMTAPRQVALPPTRTAQEPMPSQGPGFAAPRSRSPIGRIAAAAALVILGALGVTAWGLSRHDSKPAAQQTTSNDLVSGGATTPNASASTTAGSPDDPLGVGYSQINPTCDGGAVVVIQEFDKSGTDADKIRRALDGVSGTSAPLAYANKALSCSSLSLQKYAGAKTYIPFYGPYDTPRAACEDALRRSAAAGSGATPSTFVAQLADGLDPKRQPFRCFTAFSASELPTLTVADDKDAVGSDNFWVSEVEWTLYQLGVPGDITKDNHYTDATAKQVARYQKSRGIPATGDVDTATWEALQADYS